MIVTAASFPLLYHYLSRIFREFQEKEPLYQQAVHGLLFSLFSEINRITMSAADSVMSESGTAILISAARSVIWMHIIMSHFPSAALRSTAASAKAICAGCLKIWWGSVLWSICSITASSRPHLIHLNRCLSASHCAAGGHSSFPALTSSSSVYASPSEWKKEHLADATPHEVRSYDDHRTRHIFQI